VSSADKGGRKNTAANSGTKRKTGKSTEKAERDPNAPKRPANPFFQFCQEQRPIVMERLGMEQKCGEAEPSKQELTRQLASKWNTLPPEDKKVRVFEIKDEKKIFCIYRLCAVSSLLIYGLFLCCQEFF